MTVRLITVPVEGVGELRSRQCDCLRTEDGEDGEDDERMWCEAFKRWIEYDENMEPERLNICIDSEVTG